MGIHLFIRIWLYLYVFTSIVYIRKIEMHLFIRAGSPEFANKSKSIIRDGSTEREGS